jgi:choline dehydrogenase
MLAQYGLKARDGFHIFSNSSPLATRVKRSPNTRGRLFVAANVLIGSLARDKQMGTSFDYVVVGGGTSGCVAAAKLVSTYNAKVLVLEAGPNDVHPLLRMPAGFIKMLKGSKYLSFRESIPQSQLFGRIQIVPQANVLGGGSTVNAQVYLRGRVADWDAWRTLTGSDLWSWNAILPHFVAQEGNAKFHNEFHGSNGPMLVSDPGYICEMSQMYVRAAQESGLGYNPDFNDGNPHGTGFMQMTNRAGRRCSVVDAFIKPLAHDSRLTIKTGTRVKRVVLAGGEAVGVEFEHEGATQRIDPAKDVILAAGAFSTPHLMMLSGLGPADQLREHGIEVAVDLPGVGENLQDHHEAPVMAETRRNLGYYKQDRGIPMLLNGLQYTLFKSGPVTSNGVEACSFAVPEDGSGDPVIQIYCVPTTTYRDPDVKGVPDVDGVTLNACLLRPRSRGWVRLRSANPNEAPLINSNYLANADDVRHIVEGLRAARRIIATHEMRKEVVREIFPGPAVESQTALEEHARRTVKTNYHPVGTCRMGRANDQMAVVTPDMRVRGVQRLRIIDLSVVPQLMSANTNAPAMAIGDRAADMIYEKAHGSRVSDGLEPEQTGRT